MNYEAIKNQVKEAFVGVDSEAFLQLKINEAAELHAKDFQKYLKENRNGTLEHWKEITQKSINIFSNEIMPIGIFLLALDQYIETVNIETANTDLINQLYLIGNAIHKAKSRIPNNPNHAEN